VETEPFLGTRPLTKVGGSLARFMPITIKQNILSTIYIELLFNCLQLSDFRLSLPGKSDIAVTEFGAGFIRFDLAWIRLTWYCRIYRTKYIIFFNVFLNFSSLFLRYFKLNLARIIP
jgi:hypothetical protein